MKLFWDFKYFKVVIYVLFTFIGMYILKIAMDLLKYIFIEFDTVSYNVDVFLKYLFSAFSPLIIAFSIAYVLDPVVEFFQRKGSHILKNKYDFLNNRILGTTLTFSIISLVLTLLIFILALNVNSEESLLSSSHIIISKYINEFSDTFISFELYLASLGIHEYFADYLKSFINMFSMFSQSFANSLLQIIIKALGTLLNILLALVVSFYFLKDKHAIMESLSKCFNSFIPLKLNRKIRSINSNIHYTFSGYLRGQLIDAVIMSILISILLSMLKVNFAIIIGIISGFANFIPFFGALTGLVLSVVSAIVSGEIIIALYAAIGVLVLQVVDSIFIAPKIVGKNVKLSPVVIILALAISGKLFGILGMFLTVPVCAFVKLCVTNKVYDKLNK